MSAQFSVIMTTCSNREDAGRLASLLIDRRLAACVQVTDITSYYRWEGSVNNEGEALLLIKTRADRYADIEACIKENHNYEVPEIVQVPIAGGLSSYLAWIDEETGEE
mgnify:CR=1 FL=1